jgi:hypothetical protein
MSIEVVAMPAGRAECAPPAALPIIGAFLLGGLLWGVVARAWMRLVTADPEFTWSGTTFIVVAFTIAAGAQGVAWAVRERGWPRWAQAIVRTLALVLALPLGSGAGIVMLPALVTGSLAVGRTDWPRWLRVALATVALLNTAAVFPLLLLDLSWGRAIVGWLTMVPLYAVIVAAIALTLRPISMSIGSSG